MNHLKQRVLVIGAGPTGLALANGLRRAGDIEVTVVERAPVIVEAGWAISLRGRHFEARGCRLAKPPTQASVDAPRCRPERGVQQNSPRMQPCDRVHER